MISLNSLRRSISFHGFGAPYGVYATLGNHEYFRGVKEVRRIFERSPIPLLVNQSETLIIRGTQVCLAGIDDPQWLREVDPEFYKRTIDQALNSSPSEAFTILMSHRPGAFDYASSRNIDVTLAGHTLAANRFMGRSIFECTVPPLSLGGIQTR